MRRKTTAAVISLRRLNRSALFRFLIKNYSNRPSGRFCVVAVLLFSPGASKKEETGSLAFGLGDLAGQGAEPFEGDLFGPFGGFDPGGVQHVFDLGHHTF